MLYKSSNINISHSSGITNLKIINEALDESTKIIHPMLDVATPDLIKQIPLYPYLYSNKSGLLHDLFFYTSDSLCFVAKITINNIIALWLYHQNQNFEADSKGNIVNISHIYDNSKNSKNSCGIFSSRYTKYLEDEDCCFGYTDLINIREGFAIPDKDTEPIIFIRDVYNTQEFVSFLPNPIAFDSIFIECASTLQKQHPRLYTRFSLDNVDGVVKYKGDF